jgi:MFS family permease
LGSQWRRTRSSCSSLELSLD